MPKDQLEPGDIVFFDGLGHVGIYIGGGEFVHAPHTGTVVQVSSLDCGLLRRLATTAPAGSVVVRERPPGGAGRLRAAKPVTVPP